MADNGAGIFDDFLGTASNIGNLFAIFVLAGIIPLMKWINQKITEYRKLTRKKEDERIVNLAETVTKPIDEKIGQIEDLIKKTAEQNEANAQNLEKMTKAFMEYQKIQNPINMKIEYIDDFFREFVTQKSRSRHQGRFKQDSNP